MVLGCMTLERRGNLQMQLDSLNEDSSNLAVYGREELLDILQNR